MLESDIQDPDSALWVKFYTASVKNNFRSEKEGHPCFDNKVFISIIAPGDVTSKVDRAATDDDKSRFHKQWASFQAGQSDKIDGMPIREWPQITAAMADELQYLGVRSIEQLAGASDAQVQKIMGGVSLREKAKAFLRVAKDSAEAQRIASENQDLRDRISALEAQIVALGSKAVAHPVQPAATTTVAPIQAVPKRRGRPPKTIKQAEQSA